LRGGFAELPLHDGHVPPWLLNYMKRLGEAIVRHIVEVYGPREVVRRLSDPFWFQAFNNVIGMDWDSSGSTTVVIYVLKSFANASTFRDLGFAVLGGKGDDSRRIPEELKLLEGAVDSGLFEVVSRLSAKIDGVALQDGYRLYIHSLIISDGGEWTVVQQGMNVDVKLARRYHIYGDNAPPQVEDDPHSGVASARIEPALNLVDRESGGARKAIIDLVSSTSVGMIVEYIAEVNRVLKGVRSLTEFSKNLGAGPVFDWRRVEVFKDMCPRFYRPITNVEIVRRAAEKIRDEAPKSFSELLLVEGLGPESLRALALVADIIYGETPSFRDPTTHAIDSTLYAYAHGGKDGFPYPVSPDLLKKTLEFLVKALEDMRVGEESMRVKALRRLALFVKKISDEMTRELGLAVYLRS